MSATPPNTETQDPVKDLHSRLLAFELGELSQKMSKQPLVLFFGRHSFCDNTKYLYLQLLAANPSYDVLWCTWSDAVLAPLQAAGLPVFDMRADVGKTMNLLLQAATMVFCENPHAAFLASPALVGCIAGARKIQLWHGISVKHLDLMLVPFRDPRDAGFRNAVRWATRADHFLSPSAALDAFWVRAFGCRSLVRAGLPRNEVLRREPTPLEMIGAELPASVERLFADDARRRILLAPTWQRGAAMHISEPDFHARLATWARANDAVVITKTHPFYGGTGLPAPIGDSVHYVDAGTDLYPWMSRIDALVTDYSSIMFDFLLTNKPICTYDTRTQVDYGFEPDWSLVPAHDFRQSFDRRSAERVLTEALASHPMAASQREMIAALYETDPLHASAQLIQLVDSCTEVALDTPFDVLFPEAAPVG